MRPRHYGDLLVAGLSSSASDSEKRLSKVECRCMALHSVVLEYDRNKECRVRVAVLVDMSLAACSVGKKEHGF